MHLLFACFGGHARPNKELALPSATPSSVLGVITCKLDSDTDVTSQARGLTSMDSDLSWQRSPHSSHAARQSDERTSAGASHSLCSPSTALTSPIQPMQPMQPMRLPTPNASARPSLESTASEQCSTSSAAAAAGGHGARSKARGSIESSSSEHRLRLHSTFAGPVVAGERSRRQQLTPARCPASPLSPCSSSGGAEGACAAFKERRSTEHLQQQMYSGALLYGDTPADVARRLLSRYRSGRTCSSSQWAESAAPSPLASLDGKLPPAQLCTSLPLAYV